MNRRFFSISIIFVFAFFINITTFGVQNQPDINQMLHQAIAGSDVQQIQTILSNGANINFPNQLGWTPLHAAIRFGRNDVVKLLIENGANLNAQDMSGKTPLQFAVESAQNNTVEFLIQNGAEVNITNNNGDNALSIAQKIEQRATVEFLQENGATPPGGSNQDRSNNRRGMPPGVGNFQGNQMPEYAGSRRGPGQRGNDINPNFPNPDQSPNMQMPADMDVPLVQADTAPTGDTIMDPNEVKARIQAYEGLEEAIQEVADKSQAGMRQWRRTEEDNRHLLASAVRRQYEAELGFIKEIAVEEDAKKTIETTENLLSIKKDRFRIITREVRDQIEQDERQNRTTGTSSRRGGRTTTTRTRGRTTTNVPVNTQPDYGTTQVQESKYDPETQGEIDQWMSANVLNISGRTDLMNTINDMVMSDINSIKQIATEENANKTIAVIDGLLLARQQRFDELQNEFEEESQQQSTTMQYMPNTQTGTDMPRGGQGMPTGRGRRGR